MLLHQLGTKTTAIGYRTVKKFNNIYI